MNNRIRSCAAAIVSVLVAAVCSAAPQVEFELRLAAEEVTLHEPVWLDLTIHNRSAEAVEVDLGHNARNHLAFVVRTPDGTRLVLPQTDDQGFGPTGRVTIEPGRSHTRRYLLNEWYAFPLSGMYVIEVALNGPPRMGYRSITRTAPQSVTLTVTPRDEARLDAVAKQLAAVAIDEKNAAMRMAAASALSRIDDPVAVPHLIRLLRSRSWSRAEAARGLARIDTPAARAALAEALEDPDPEFRTLVHQRAQGGKP